MLFNSNNGKINSDLIQKFSLNPVCSTNPEFHTNLLINPTAVSSQYMQSLALLQYHITNYQQQQQQQINFDQQNDLANNQLLADLFNPTKKDFHNKINNNELINKTSDKNEFLCSQENFDYLKSTKTNLNLNTNSFIDYSNEKMTRKRTNNESFIPASPSSSVKSNSSLKANCLNDKSCNFSAASTCKKNCKRPYLKFSMDAILGNTSNENKQLLTSNLMSSEYQPSLNYVSNKKICLGKILNKIKYFI